MPLTRSSTVAIAGVAVLVGAVTGAGATYLAVDRDEDVGAARNVILIVGDGIGFSTVTATRIFEC